MFASFFKRKDDPKPVALLTDIHSHLLPGLDDGVADFEEALKVIVKFRSMGYKKLITTPHIMSDSYRNDATSILGKLKELKQLLIERNVDMVVEAAAEYYFDIWLFNEILENRPLLTFGKNYLLFETNYLTEPYQLNDFIFKLSTNDYQPVLAHPERYQFMTIEKAEDLRNRGVLFQLNLLSFSNYYSKKVKKMAEKLVEHGWVDFLGSDCHTLDHTGFISDAFKNKYVRKAMTLPLLNHQL